MSSWNTFIYFLKAYPARGAVMIASLTVAGFLEGIGILALLPLISTLTNSAPIENGILKEFVTVIFDFFAINQSIVSTLLFIVGVMLLKACVSMFATVQIAYSSSHVSANLRLNYINHLMQARWSHYVNLRSGSLANAIGTEAQRAALSFKQGCQAFSFIIQIAVYALLAVTVSATLTVAALCAGIFIAALLSFLIKKARRSGKLMTATYENVLSLITDGFYGAKPLKAMNKANNLYKLLEKNIRNLQFSQRRLDIIDQGIGILSEPLMVIFISAGLYGALSSGNLPLPELLFMAVLFLRTVMRMSSAQRSYQGMAANESALHSLLEKSELALGEKDDRHGKLQPIFETSIFVDSVSFSYKNTPILEKVSLNIQANTLQVIFGPSGTGKTTLVDLIIGLYHPSSGDIKVDGVSLKDIDQKLWSQKVGYVPQDVLLFHDTLMNNVTLNDPFYDKKDVEQALKMADAWEFVQHLEDGLETVVGERGSRFSGGQRQRIAIARAVIHKPAILVLDEATSALDPETEQQILKTVKKLSLNMTILAISHNPAILEVADHIYKIGENRET